MSQNMHTDYTGGSAFPVTPGVDQHGQLGVGQPYPEPGMTLRDYFAAKAMGAMVGTGEHAFKGFDGYEYQLAANAYRVADAMIAARESRA